MRISLTYHSEASTSPDQQKTIKSCPRMLLVILVWVGKTLSLTIMSLSVYPSRFSMFFLLQSSFRWLICQRTYVIHINLYDCLHSIMISKIFSSFVWSLWTYKIQVWTSILEKIAFFLFQIKKISDNDTIWNFLPTITIKFEVKVAQWAVIFISLSDNWNVDLFDVWCDSNLDKWIERSWLVKKPSF